MRRFARRPSLRRPRGRRPHRRGGRLHLAVFHTRDGVFATQPDCPHLQGPRADSLTGTGTILCPLHDRIFDLRGGAGLNNDCRLAAYKLTVGGDGTIRLALPVAELAQV